jgi:NOL1/NOP2/fmu family ribosome biogenesis protein
MPDPMDKPQFDALIARHGIPLTEAEKEGVRAVTIHTLAMAERVRAPRAVSVEMAVTFAPKAATP